MKKLLLTTAIIAVTGATMSTTASAGVLAADANLSIDDFVLGGYYGNVVVGGSFFAMDTNGDGIFQKGERTGLEGAGGINVNTEQAQTEIDKLWSFFNNDGAHSTLTATNIGTNVDGSGTAELDFSGWTVDWNSTEINMGSGGSAGVATVVCNSGDCSSGTYTIDYLATVPDDGSTNFGNVTYALHLEGTIGTAPAVPVPAAVWLFGSGLLGLVGVARRRKVA